MTNITNQIYLEKLKICPLFIKDYISNIFSNTSFIVFLDTYEKLEDQEQNIADLLRSEVILLTLKINTFEQFIDDVVDILEIQPSEAEKVVSDLYTKCIPEQVRNFIEKGSEESANTNSKKVLIEDTHISHLDVLNEIENPTPSLRTTTDFQNIQNQNSTSPLAQSQTPVSSSNPLFSSANTSNTPINPTNLTPSTPFTPTASLHSPEPIALYVNPALQISSKLGQNLSTPSVSTSKDVYVSKKPDPYHEPVDL